MTSNAASAGTVKHLKLCSFFLPQVEQLPAIYPMAHHILKWCLSATADSHCSFLLGWPLRHQEHPTPGPVPILCLQSNEMCVFSYMEESDMAPLTLWVERVVCETTARIMSSQQPGGQTAPRHEQPSAWRVQGREGQNLTFLLPVAQGGLFWWITCFTTNELQQQVISNHCLRKVWKKVNWHAIQTNLQMPRLWQYCNVR